jgi:hypothetical protein
MRDIFKGLKTDLAWIFKAVIDSARTRTRLPVPTALPSRKRGARAVVPEIRLVRRPQPSSDLRAKCRDPKQVSGAILFRNDAR